VREGTRKKTEEGDRSEERHNPRPGRGKSAPYPAKPAATMLPKSTEPDIYVGLRGSLWFYESVKTAMDERKLLVGNKCEKPGCVQTNGLAIDHVKSFSGQILEVEYQIFCYGGWHFEGSLFQDALEIYNAGLSPTETLKSVDMEGKFQWLCTKHNSSKGGTKEGSSVAPHKTEHCPDWSLGVGAPLTCDAEKVKQGVGGRRIHADYEN